MNVPYASCKAGYDPAARIEHMDREGVDATFLYPSLGLVLGGIEDPSFATACYRAYNRWLADFCAGQPSRLYGVAMIPMQSVEHAIAELRFARRELGMRAGFIRPNPYLGRLLHDRAYDPLWAEAQELDMAISVHSGSASDMPTVGMDRYGDGIMTRHIVSHALEAMLAMVSFVFCGVCERFPRLRLGFFEGGAGWVAGWLDRMDRHYEKVISDDDLSLKPSEIFRRQCWIAYDPGEKGVPHIAEYVGFDRFMWATDFPHPDGVPFGARLVQNNDTLSNERKSRLLAKNAMAFYGLI